MISTSWMTLETRKEIEEKLGHPLSPMVYFLLEQEEERSMFTISVYGFNYTHLIDVDQERVLVEEGMVKFVQLPTFVELFVYVYVSMQLAMQQTLNLLQKGETET